MLNVCFAQRPHFRQNFIELNGKCLGTRESKIRPASKFERNFWLHDIIKKTKKKQPKNVPIFSFLNILMEKVTLFNTQFQMDLYVFVVLLLLLRFVFAWNKVNYLFALMDASALVMLYSILFFCLTTYVSNSFEMPLNMANIGQKHLNSVLF